MENGYATTALKEDEIELELGLSLGGSLRKAEELKPINNGIDSNLTPQLERIEADRTGFCRDLVDSQKERRLEAKRKREAKQQKKRVSGGGRNKESTNGAGVNGFDSAGERGFKRMKVEAEGGSRNSNGNIKGVDLNVSIEQDGNQSVGSGQTRFPQVHSPSPNFTPLFNNEVPILNGGIVGADGKTIQPMASTSFRPYKSSQQLRDHNLIHECGSKQNAVLNRDCKENGKTVSNGSPICSSSGVSDPNSSSLQGGRSCEQYAMCSNQTETAQSIDKSNPKPNPNVAETQKGANSERETERTQSQNLSQMPCVTTTGNGPNGKTINGFLYRYSKSEVSIVCVCHGSSFSPAEFVKHAGGTDVSHPLRHITVIPFAF